MADLPNGKVCVASYHMWRLYPTRITTRYWNSSGSEDEETTFTKYGKQKLFVSHCFHVFEFRNEVEEVSFQNLLQFLVLSIMFSHLVTFPRFGNFLAWLTQGSHSDWKTWKTWKNGKAFSSQGKVREF